MKPKYQLNSGLKICLQTVTPVLILLYTISILTTMSGMEIFGWSTAVFTLCLMVLDRWVPPREYKIYFSTVLYPVAALIVISIISLLINPPDPSTTLLDEIGSMRWALLLAILMTAFQIAPQLNRTFWVFVGLGTAVSAYGIYQHFTGDDFRFLWGLRHDNAVTPAPHENGLFQAVGLFGHHLTFGHSYVQLLGFPVAAFFLSSKKTAAFRWCMAACALVIGLALIWTYGRGVWLAAAMSLAIVSLFLGKRYFVSLVGVVGVLVLLINQFSPGFHERLTSVTESSYQSNVDRRILWKANILMFQENPWFGVGLGRNENRAPEFLEKIGHPDAFAGHAHNVYFQWLATTGFLGFTCYMLFILGALFVTVRLWAEIPKTHTWHRIFILGSLGAQVAFHTGGLTQWNFGDAEVNHLFIFIVAFTLYLGARYRTEIIPDDRAL